MHEQKHEAQWQTGMFSNLFEVASFMQVISNLTSTTRAGLTQQINQAHLNWANQQGQLYQNQKNAAEIEAFNISDPIAPMYAYQRCGRTQF